MSKELKVIQDFQDLSLYLMERILKFPRNLRHGLGLAIEHRLLDLLALFIRAKYATAGANSWLRKRPGAANVIVPSCSVSTST